MSNSQITQNIIHPVLSLLDKNSLLYIITDSSSSIFDKALETCQKLVILPQQNASPYVSYDALFSTDPTTHTTNISAYKDEHIRDIVYFRDIANNQIKKEDKFLIQNKLSKTNKILRNSAIQSSWHIKDNQEYIEYGIPRIEIKNISVKKSILFINTSNSKTIDVIYQDIKRHIPDADILGDITRMKYQDIADKLQQYKLCFDIEDSYNILAAVSNGCRVLSTKKIEHCDSFLLDSIFNIENLLDLIKDELSSYSQYDWQNASKEVTSYYDFEIFEAKLYDCFIETLRKPFLL